jgi:hypothetical protein
MHQLSRFFILLLVCVNFFMFFSVPGTGKAAKAVVAGDVIQGIGLPTLYYLDSEGVRHPFPNDRTYFTWYTGFSNIKKIPQSRLRDYPLGDAVRYRAGTRLIKVRTDPKVYAVEYGGTLRWITSAYLAEQLYGKRWNTLIDDLPDVFFSLYKRGDDITTSSHPSGTLIRYSFDPDAVYLVEESLKRHVRSESVFRANNYQWRHVSLVSSSDVYYDDGDPVTGFEPRLFDPAQLAYTGEHRVPFTLIKGVPDANQPPTNTLQLGNLESFSVPIASAIILKYWEDERLHPEATGVSARLSEKTLAEYLGYFMDVNNRGSSRRLNIGTGGVLIDDIDAGIKEYLLWDGSSPTSYGFPVSRSLPSKRGYNNWNVRTETLDNLRPSDAFFNLKQVMKNNQPVLVTFEHWNIQKSGEKVSGIPLYDWGYSVTSPQDGKHPMELWTKTTPNTKSSGHGVVAVGYIEDFEVDGVRQDWVIVHDTWTSTPDLLAVPWGNWLASTYILPQQNVAPYSPQLSINKTSLLRNETARLSWTQVANAKYFELAVGTTTNFSDARTSRTNGSTLYYDFTPRISESDTLYFRVRALNDAGSGGWSNTVILQVTSLSTPILRVTGNRTSLVSGETARINWTDVSGPNGYHLQIALETSFSNPQTIQRDDSTPYYDFIAPSVTQFTYYYFRVRGYDRSGNGPWARSIWVSVAPSPQIQIPTLRGPSEVVSGNTITLSWNTINGAVGYQVQKSTASNFSTAQTLVVAANRIQYEDTPVANVRTNYYYRVRTDFGNRQGGWSNTLIVVVKPAAPYLQGPPVATSGNMMTVFWTDLSGVSGYRLQYATNNSFSNSTTITLGNNTLEYDFTPPIFVNSYYYFRVQGYSNAGNGEWSNTVVTYVQADHAPSLQGPSENVRNGVLFTVTWNRIDGAAGYQIQVDTNSNFSAADLYINPSDDFNFSYVPNTQVARYYYVRARAYANTGEGDWSNVLQIWVSL